MGKKVSSIERATGGIVSMKNFSQWIRLSSVIGLSALVMVLMSGCQSGTEETGTNASQEEEHDHDHGHEHGEEEAGHEGHEHEEGEHSEEGGEEAHSHSHSHDPLYGGTLIAFGDHFAHAEVVLDATAGTLTLYLLDGGAEAPVRVAQESITVEVTPRTQGAEKTSLTLQPVANPLTGETVGDTSQFQIQDPSLAGVSEFDGVIVSVSIKGSELKDVAFGYPEGNE
jgi:hypothetical protein